MRGAGRLPILLAAAALTSCISPRYAPAPSGPPPVAERPRPYAPRPYAAPERAAPTAGETIPLTDLPGWYAEDHAAALRAFAAGCGVSRDPGLATLCRDARALGPVDDAAARAFLEQRLRAERIGDEGVLTAYFAPEYEARETRDAPFTAPVRPRPSGVEALRSVGDRAAIEASDPEQALAWMKPEDLFFMQIQGSGLLDLPDGRRLKASFAISNGQRFVPIARVLRERGDIAANETTGDAIRAWLAEHRGPEADQVMDQDPRYVFFAVTLDDGREPAGTAGEPLIPGRSIAVDQSQHELGGAYWIDADSPTLAGAPTLYRRLVMALDTGGAIKGAARADLYLGRGDAAGDEAGRVRHVLKLYALVPSAP